MGIMTMPLCAVLLLSSGCATKRIAASTVNSVRSYAGAQEKRGLQIAVTPILDAVVVKKEFGYNMLKDGGVPILIVAENHGDQSFLLPKEKIKLAGSETELDKHCSGTAGETTAIIGAAGMVLLGPLFVGAVLVGAQSACNATKIEHALKVKEWHSTTLSPGTKAHGYLYFQMPKDTPDGTKWYLDLSPVNPADETEAKFRFPLKLK
jgi:hypothetical protein